MPTPHPDKETSDDWMGRCIPTVMNDGSADNQDQAVAMCAQMWRDAGGKMPKPKKNASENLYSLIIEKQIDEDLRVLRGVATTPVPDRMGDIVEPQGVKFRNPIPLLWQHDTKQPVGTAKLGRPTENGITFEAKIPKVMEPGRLKDRLDEVWQSIKSGLVRGVSIGFKALEMSFLKDGGVHFVKTEVLELSLVTIPANSQATIEQIKACDVKCKDMGGMEMMMPYPASDEVQSAFMSRCVDHMLNCNDEMTSKEATAHCSVIWETENPKSQRLERPSRRIMREA